MATARGAVSRSHGDYRHIVDYYRETLPNVAPPAWLTGQSRWRPITLGPTWDWTPERGWRLPEHSMGWEVLGWCGLWLRDMKGQPWEFTPEQARFLLWYHGIDGGGRLLHRTAVFQRLKGHGKDPLACAESCAHAFGPVVFDHWENGEPVGHENEAAWVQITAVSKEQTANTLKLFPVMVSQEARTHYGIQIGRENVWGLRDTRQIQATSSNYLSLEGNRVTEAIRNEPQNWNSSNQGHDLAGTIDGNSTKAVGGLGRILDIENAFRPGEDSVAERLREAWENTQATEHRDPRARAFRMLYDSLEAPPDAPLTAEAAPEVLEAVRGDSTWLDIPSIVDSIVNGANTPSESRRKWYNQIVSTADAWLSPQEWDRCYRDEHPVAGDQIVVFFDGSKSDDHTAAVGVRVSDGLSFPIGIWVPEKVRLKGGRETTLPVDRAAVDHEIRQSLATYDVIGLWADPSDARDDDTGERYWEPYLDGWARDYRRQLNRLPAVKTGIAQHLVIWDMRNPVNLKRFTEACERAASDVIDQLVFHNCPQPNKTGRGVLMRQHVLNARRRPNKFGISIGKEHRESRKKIDAAVCFVGARMMWHHYNQLTPKGRVPGTGRVITP
ncbi:terminase [Mycobacterium malmoense]|uniref:terminase n=1 Tax=Mycobacterium malmoense TaxID=1780 RepID=UPI000B2FD7C7|nr:terminase [Mycobacterium malmoense]